MRALIQRVQYARLHIGGEVYSSIGPGMVILLGITHTDDIEDSSWLVRKISGLRIFDDREGVMNLDAEQVDGEFMVVSQFTLHASTKKGNRPSYIRAAGEDIAKPLYEKFVELLGTATNKTIATGIFGADMKVELVNDGPVTIWIDTENKD